jgi:hypothetical protein
MEPEVAALSADQYEVIGQPSAQPSTAGAERTANLKQRSLQ